MINSTPMLVAASYSTRDWRIGLQRHVRDHESDIVIELVRDRHQAAADAVEMVIVDDDTSWINANVVDSFRKAHKAVIGIYDSAESDGYGQQFLRSLGIDLVVPADLPVDALITFLRRHRPDRQQRTQDDRALVGFEPPRGQSDSRVIAVGGPSGAGSTEVAIGLSSLAAPSSLLLEVDENHPGIARRLGLSIHPHIVTAIDVMRRGAAVVGDTADAPTIRSCLASAVLGQSPLPFDVVVGLASRDDWSLLRPDDVVSLVDQLVGAWSTVIVKTGSSLEDLGAVPRFDVSRTVVASADRIVGVADASPTGLLHFVDWFVDAAALAERARFDVVMNRAPSSPSLRNQLREELDRIAGERIDSVLMVPADRRVSRAAWDASLPSRGPFLKALTPLVVDPVPQRRAGPRARRAVGGAASVAGRAA